MTTSLGGRGTINNKGKGNSSISLGNYTNTINYTKKVYNSGKKSIIITTTKEHGWRRNNDYKKLHNKRTIT